LTVFQGIFIKTLLFFKVRLQKLSKNNPSCGVYRFQLDVEKNFFVLLMCVLSLLLSQDGWLLVYST